MRGGGTTARNIANRAINDGALTNSPKYAPSQASSSTGVSLTAASSQLISVPYSSALECPNITIIAWGKPNASSRAYVCSRNYAGSVPYHLCAGGSALGGTQMDGFARYSGGWASSGITTDVRGDGKFHQIGGSFDGATLKYWVDGKLDASQSNGTALPTQTSNLFIGEYPNDGHYWDGILDHVLIWNRALSAAEIRQLYENPFCFLGGGSRRRPFGVSIGGSFYSVTATDGPSTSDALTRAAVVTRTLAAAPTTNDTLARLATLGRPLVDSPSTSDGLVSVKALPRSLSESPSTSDSPARAIVSARPLSDNPTVSDSLVRAETLARSNADSPATSDSLVRVIVSARPLADAPLVSDSLARVLVLARPLADSVSTADVIARIEVAARGLADGPTVSDGLVRVLLAARSAADSASTTDALARALTLGRPLGDAPTVSDSLNASSAKARSAADSPSTSDVLEIAGITVTAADSPATLDALVRIYGGVRSLADSPSVVTVIVVTAPPAPLRQIIVWSGATRITVDWSGATADISWSGSTRTEVSW
ncbi:MAG TPA: LamG domain-containing protein [Gemmataceae bacterium]|nr:LamG domain-containing protein [Gemmataceae bacterium]